MVPRSAKHFKPRDAVATVAGRYHAVVRIAGLVRDVLEFCYPDRCARCDAVSGQPFLCMACDAALRDLEGRPACGACAMPIGEPGGACPYCEGRGLANFDRVVSLGAYRDPLRHLVVAAKYHHRWTVAERLADRLLEQPGVTRLMDRVECVVPVPLHRLRQVARGFNQAEVIARRLARRCGKRFARPAVRLRNTETQTHLHSRAKREANLKDAFGLVSDSRIRGRHVLIVDDVMTTGATLQSLARALAPAEPASLSAVVLAVADPLGQDFQVI
jgi:ComF family protein